MTLKVNHRTLWFDNEIEKSDSILHYYFFPFGHERWTFFIAYSNWKSWLVPIDEKKEKNLKDYGLLDYLDLKTNVTHSKYIIGLLEVKILPKKSLA